MAPTTAKSRAGTHTDSADDSGNVVRPTKYVAAMIGSAIFSLVGLVGFALLISPPLSTSDHLGQIPLDDDYRLYRNYGDWMGREIQDRDIFYHGVGQSIENARKADIILLGHSMVLWGFDSAKLREFENKYGVRIYNMGSAGDASGEFLRRVIVRWDLHPKLWIVNADDKAGNFFDIALEDQGGSGPSSAAHVVQYGRLRGYFNVVSRNLRWRIQQYLAERLPDDVRKSLFPGPALQLWRNIETGDWFLERMPRYLEPQKNPPITVTRDQQCPATAAEIDKARAFFRSVKGNAALMLIPYYAFCPLRVRQIADALQLDAIIPPTADYTSGDGGGHLDHDGAKAYTTFFLSQLERLSSFRAILAQKGRGPF